MRTVIAALFVVGGIFAAVALLGESGAMDGGPPLAIGLGLGLLLVCLSIAAVLLFNPWWANPFSRMTPRELIPRLENRGLLVSTEYQARRAFGIEESDDEGPHYFLELIDGGVLYLVGQYLYDYEPISDDTEMNQPRRFPCTDFTIRRHKTEGYVIEVVCRGPVIEPECVFPALTGRSRSIGSPTDGQVLSNRPYDDLKDAIGPVAPG